MKILSISDFHGNVDVLEPLAIKAGEINPDVIVFSGDIVKGSLHREEKSDLALYFKFYEVINSIKKPVFVIPGNMDAPAERYFKVIMESEAVYENIICVHGRSIRAGRDMCIGGLGGEVTLNERDDALMLKFPAWEAKYLLGNLAQEESDKILLFHTPPISTVDMEQGKHKGCGIVNELIKSLAPKFAFCGHAHNARGKDTIGDTLVINPGALKYGNYAIVQTDTKKVEFGKLK